MTHCGHAGGPHVKKIEIPLHVLRAIIETFLTFDSSVAFLL
jgi:hypothetical protein